MNSEDWRKGLAVKSIIDHEFLLKAALNDYELSVRLAAVDELKDEESLKQIALVKNWAVSCHAVMKLKDEEFLKELAEKGYHKFVRNDVKKRLEELTR